MALTFTLTFHLRLLAYILEFILRKWNYLKFSLQRTELKYFNLPITINQMNTSH